MPERPPASAPPAAVRTPEGRRRQALRWREELPGTLARHIGPGSHAFAIVRRVAVGVWQDGFIHAGNLAYMGIVALFPFFVTVAALFSVLGEGNEQAASVGAFLAGLPPVVRHALSPVAHDAMMARHGWLLFAGGVIGLWTVSSLVETIRDILHRAYGVALGAAFWRYRLFSGLMILGAVVLLLFSLYAQVLISTAAQVIMLRFHRLEPLARLLNYGQLVPMLVLFGSVYLLFLLLTPAIYRGRAYPKWPGALLVTLWWALVSIALPVLLHFVFKYDLTYGSLAGVMIALFFFWLVGLGIVTGAELNAALTETPEERDMIGQADDRGRTQDRGRTARQPTDERQMDEEIRD